MFTKPARKFTEVVFTSILCTVTTVLLSASGLITELPVQKQEEPTPPVAQSHLDISPVKDSMGRTVAETEQTAMSIAIGARSYLDSFTEADLIDMYIYELTSTQYPDLDPELVRAIVYHESRYIPDALNNNSGATGLMQLMPKWHMGRAESLGVSDLTDPYGNILTGCDLLNELLERYSYDYALNIYAGGYTYANLYKESTSPFVNEIASIKHGLEEGYIIL